MKLCLICETPIEPFLNFGRMPIANGFLSPSDFANEYFFELQAACCPCCAMVQLMERVDPRRMFHAEYAFFSSTSQRMAAHFQEFAGTVRAMLASEGQPFVVELGSNDGIMLQHFTSDGFKHLGIEPSANVAAVARERGINTWVEFFNETIAERIVSEYGQADAILAANVMCHIPGLHSVAAGVKRLLKPQGLLVFEDPYWGDIVERTSYDQIYDEHVFYFSAAAVRYLFRTHGLELVDVQSQEVHGGSMRYVLAHAGSRVPSATVTQQLAKEETLALARISTGERFRQNVERSRDLLMTLLHQLRQNGKRVAGYAATSKSTTVINYCGITPDLLAYISDTTPLKQGKYSPGAHIPVRPHTEFAAAHPDFALLFGWNHAEEIFANEQAFRAGGGKWIVYVPQVKVLE